MLEIIFLIIAFLFIGKIIYTFWTTHPSDKYHNDTWKQDRKKNKKTRQN